MPSSSIDLGQSAQISLPIRSNNLKFTLAREPGNEAAREMLPQVTGHDPAQSRVTTLAEERRINTFMRLDSPGVIAKLRELRNQW